MRLLSGLLGNASEIDVQEVEKELELILVRPEQIERAIQLMRDLIVFTDKRMILVNKHGFTGKKVEYHSIPYRSVSSFSIETAGFGDAKLTIWVSGINEPIKKEFKKDNTVYEVQNTVARLVLK